MNFENESPREGTRIFVCGSCDGSAALVEALAQEPGLELVGVSPTATEAAGTLAGGHLSVVLHATGAQTLPADEIAVIREHTRAPIVVLASGETTQLLEQALDADVADVLLLPQLTENVVFAIRKAAHAGRRLVGGAATTHGRIVTVFSPKGGTGKTAIATNLATALAKHEGKKTLLLVCSLDVPTIKNVRLSLQTLELLSFPMRKVRLVLNRSNSKVGMKEGEVETALERKVRFQIPSDRAVPLAVNRGNPVVLGDSGSDFARALRDVAKHVANPEPEKQQKRRRFFAKA